MTGVRPFKSGCGSASGIATVDTRDAAGFRRLVRTAIFGFLQEVAARDWESAASRLATGQTTALMENELATAEAKQIEKAFAVYFEARGRFRLDPEGRAAKHTYFSEAGDAVSQVLVDKEAFNDWEVKFIVSLTESRAQNRAVVRFESVQPVGGDQVP